MAPYMSQPGTTFPHDARAIVLASEICVDDVLCSLLAIHLSFSMLSPSIRWNLGSAQRTKTRLSSNVVITTLCILCGVGYITSRAYPVIEAFASIREVPKGVWGD
jgi:hypothetical protein